MNTVYDASLYVDGKDPNLTCWDYEPGKVRDLPVLLHGNVASPGEIVPAGTCCIRPERTINSGRAPAAGVSREIFTDAAPTAARVV